MPRTIDGEQPTATDDLGDGWILEQWERFYHLHQTDDPPNALARMVWDGRKPSKKTIQGAIEEAAANVAFFATNWPPTGSHAGLIEGN